MAQTILIKRSNTANAEPTTLATGELAANMEDMRLWIGTPEGVKEFGIVSAASLAWLSHVSISGDGLPLWNGQPWGSAEAGGIGTMIVGSTFVVG
jgi:hypothetical protein